MHRTFMKSKIHRATVTASKLHYMGSITIDKDLLLAVDILPFEKVQVLNLDNGARIETYVISGRAGSGQIQINGAAARFFTKHDRVIIIAYAEVKEQEFADFQVRVALVNPQNRLKEIRRFQVNPYRRLPASHSGKIV
jgi:aspartate 1-decarboxylase